MISRNVKTYKPRVERNGRSDASMPGRIIGQDRGIFGLSGEA